MVGAKSAQKCIEEVSMILTVLSGALISIPISLRESCAGSVATSFCAVGEFVSHVKSIFSGAGVLPLSTRVPIIVKSRISTVLYLPDLYD